MLVLDNIVLCDESDKYDLVLILKPKSEQPTAIHNLKDGSVVVLEQSDIIKFKYKRWSIKSNGDCEGFYWVEDKGWFWASNVAWCSLNIEDFEIIDVERYNHNKWDLTIFKDVVAKDVMKKCSKGRYIIYD